MRKLLLLVMLLQASLLLAQQRPQYGPVTIISPSSAAIPLTLKAASPQTGDLLDIRDSANALKVQVLASGNIVLGGSETVTGTFLANGLLLANGGEQFTDLVQNAFLKVGTSGALSSTAAATNGQLLIGSTGAPQVAATLTGTSKQVTVSNGAGSITLSAPQNLDTNASTQFGRMGIGVAASAATGSLSMSGKLLLYNNSAPTNGQILIGNAGTGSWDAATITGFSTSQVIVSNGGGAITLSTPQDIAVTSSPTFSGLTVTTVSLSDGTAALPPLKFSSAATTGFFLGAGPLLGLTVAATANLEVDGTNDATNTALLVFSNGSMKRVKVQTCISTINFVAMTDTTVSCLTF